MKRIAIYVCLAIAAALTLTSCTFYSCIRIGYVGNSGKDTWSARYRKLDGYMSQRLNIDEENLCITITTEEGSISVRVIGDEDILLAEISEEGSHIVSASGKLKIEIEADDHRGSFDIKPGS